MTKRKPLTSEPSQRRNKPVPHPTEPSTEYYDPRLKLKKPGEEAKPVSNGTGKDFVPPPHVQLSVDDFPDKAWTCCVVGSRRSGKSTVAESLLIQMKSSFDVVFLFSSTLAGFDSIPNSYKFNSMEPMREIISRQQGLVEYNHEVDRRRKRYGTKEPYAVSRVCCVFDDMLATGDLKNQLLNNCFLNGRHMHRGDPCDKNHMCFMVLSQTVMGIPKSMRLNSCVVLSSRIPSKVCRQAFVEQNMIVNSMRGGVSEAFAVYDQVTTDGDFAFIALLNYKSNKRTYEDFVRGYHATVPKKGYKLFGTKEDWEVSLPNFDLTTYCD